MISKTLNNGCDRYDVTLKMKKIYSDQCKNDEKELCLNKAL